MKRSGRHFLDALTVLSLMPSAAAAAIWVDHRVRTEPGTVIRPCMQLDVALVDAAVGVSGESKAVDLSGRIELPILGKPKAGGLTCVQLETEIDDAFRYLGVTKSVVVSVRIMGFQTPNRLLMSPLLTIPASRALDHCLSSWKAKRRSRAGRRVDFPNY